MLTLLVALSVLESHLKKGDSAGQTTADHGSGDCDPAAVSQVLTPYRRTTLLEL